MVCTANICRSPTAEAVMRHRLGRAGLLDRIELAFLIWIIFMAKARQSFCWVHGFSKDFFCNRT